MKTCDLGGRAFFNNKFGRFWAVWIMIVLLGAQGRAAATGEGGSAGAVEEVIERGANHEVHQRITERLEGNEVVRTTNQWTLLQTGLSYFSSAEGVWKATETQIDLADAGAVYQRGPFNVRFAPNHNDGVAALELRLPDGRQIKLQTLGVALTDNSTGDSVWLGEVKDSNGLLDGNTIIYPDAFSGIKADVRMTVSVGKFQSDVILREQLTAPQLFGMDPSNCHLEVWHQIVDGPEPEAHALQIPRANGTTDADTQLNFGAMTIGRGTAFLVGTNATDLDAAAEASPTRGSAGAEGAADSGASAAGGLRIPVSKELFLDGESQTRFLIEGVPYTEAQPQLQTLPAPGEARIDRERLKQQLKGVRRLAGKSRSRPVSLAGIWTPASPREGKAVRRVASIERSKIKNDPGYLLDYTFLTTASDFRFKGDTTYYVNGEVNLSGKTVIEGGTVVKFSPYASLSPVIKVHGTVECQTGPYLPAVFTARDDDSVGEIIYQSTGSPSGYYAWYNLLFTTANTTALDIHDIRTSFAHNGIGLQGSATHTVSHVQAIRCYKGIEIYNNTVNVRNFLAQNSIFAFASSADTGLIGTIRAEHVTAHSATNGFFRFSTTNNVMFLTNSLVVSAGTTLTNVSTDHVTVLASDVGVFQTVGSGQHYLAAKSPYRDAGTTNINSSLVTAFRQKTTRPPRIWTSDIVKDTVLAPTIERDAERFDLGFHYDAIDFAVGGRSINGAALVLTNGVSVAVYKDHGFCLVNSAKFVSEGSPTKPNHIFRYSCVQEQPTRWDDAGHTAGDRFGTVWINSTQPQAEVTLKYTKARSLADTAARRALADFSYYSIGAVKLQHSILNNVGLNVTASQSTSFELFNNWVLNGAFEFDAVADDTSGLLGLTLQNNTFEGGSLLLGTMGAAQPWVVTDNAFSMTPAASGGGSFLNSNNGYTNSGRLPGHLNSQSFTSYPYVRSNGWCYLPQGSPLRDAGSLSSAANRGLYHFTTWTNQVKEGSSALDIGVHFPALGAGGKLADSDFDGIPDLVEDANGDGVRQETETNFLRGDTDGDGTSDGKELGLKTNPLVANAFMKKRLGYWNFDDQGLKAVTGQEPLDYTGTTVSLTPTSPFICFFGGASHVFGTTSRLAYREIDVTGEPNLDREQGTVRLWFRPDGWTPSGAPHGRLVSLGANGGLDWWTLDILPVYQTPGNSATPQVGAQIQFITQGPNGTGPTSKTHFQWTLDGDWSVPKWHQIVLVYGPSKTQLFVDNAKKVDLSGTGLAPLVPDVTVRGNDRLCFGNAFDGSAGAKGHFDEIETFNYGLSADEIARDYAAMTKRDDDHDGLPNLMEVNEVQTNPLNKDTDNDGMPDGWEYAWNKWAPSMYANAPTFNPINSNEASLEYELNGQQDGLGNIHEYWLGLNPYRNDKSPEPAKFDACPQADLINIDFGDNGGNLPTGKAATGHDETDQWNRIGSDPSTRPTSIHFANGQSSSAKVSLVMNLGHVTKFTVDCTTTSGGGHFCDWLGWTNTFHNIFCCTNLNIGRVNFDSLPANFLCLHSETGEQMYMHEGNWAPTVVGSDNGNPGVLLQKPLYRSLVPSWPWQARFGTPQWLQGMPYTQSNYQVDENGNILSGAPPVSGPVTTDGSFWTSGSSYMRVDGVVATPPEVHNKTIVATPVMESASVDGFDSSGAFQNASGRAALGILNDYLYNSLDALLRLKEPQLPTCESLWFTGDGHAQIKVDNLPFGRYRVYLYAAKPGAADVTGTGETPVKVNGSVVKIPSAGAQLPYWKIGENFAVSLTPYTTSISIDFENNLSVINAMQIMKEPEIAQWVNDPFAAFDGPNGIRVNWDPIPGFKFIEACMIGCHHGQSSACV